MWARGNQGARSLEYTNRGEVSRYCGLSCWNSEYIYILSVAIVHHSEFAHCQTTWQSAPHLPLAREFLFTPHEKEGEYKGTLPTFRPARLLWRFMSVLPFSAVSLASRNIRENLSPYLMSGLHPPHFQPSCENLPLIWVLDRSQPQLVRLPSLHAFVMAYVIDAELMANAYAASFVPVYASSPTRQNIHVQNQVNIFNYI